MNEEDTVSPQLTIREWRRVMAAQNINVLSLFELHLTREEDTFLLTQCIDEANIALKLMDSLGIKPGVYNVIGHLLVILNSKKEKECQQKDESTICTRDCSS